MRKILCDINKVGIGSRRKSKSFDLSPTSLASIESLSVPLVQEVVLPADIRCAECQKRVADVMYRMNGGLGTESVVVNVWEKKVILSCKNPDPKTPRSKRQVVSYRTTSPFNKIAVIKHIFRSSLGKVNKKKDHPLSQVMSEQLCWAGVAGPFMGRVVFCNLAPREKDS